MALAFAQAELAARSGEVPVGCVIAREGHPIVATHNLMHTLKDPTAHAELLAIREACRLLGTPYLLNADMYVTLEPCTMCAPAISRGRLRRLYYAAYDFKAGSVDHGPTFFQSSQCFHKPEVYGGIQESRGQNLLRQFFFSLR